MRELFNFRYYVLLVVAGFTLVMLFGECPDNTTFGEWIAFHFTHKIFGLCGGVYLFHVYEYWNKNNRLPLVYKLGRMIDDIMKDN